MCYICPVCKYDGLYEPAYTEDGYGSYEICPCCGFQYGYDDYPDKEDAIIKWQKNWIENGCKWFSRSRSKPDGWDAKRQLEGA